MDVIRQFGAVEDDQRYGRLVELFTDDAIYYDPFFGPQRGKDQIGVFMRHMEQVVPASGARFDEWIVQADETCGWAQWTMISRGPDGSEMGVPGQSIYRLRDGKVCFVADYLDAAAYAKLRPGSARRPNYADAGGMSRHLAAADSQGQFPALDLVRSFWNVQDSGAYPLLAPLFAEDAVSFDLVDCAGDTTVAWSQWTCNLPQGTVPGWTLHTIGDGTCTLDAAYFDTVTAEQLRR